MAIFYHLSVEGFSGTPETGYQALFGDLFSITSEPLFEVALGTPASVPEPSTVMLLGFGSCSWGGAQTRDESHHARLEPLPRIQVSFERDG